MDPNPSTSQEIPFTSIELAQQQDQHQQEIARKNRAIKVLCTDILSHMNAYAQLQTHNEALLQQTRDWNAAHKNLTETVTKLEEENLAYKLSDHELRVECARLQDENEKCKTNEREVIDAYGRLEQENQVLRVQLNRTRNQLVATQRTLERYHIRRHQVRHDDEEEEEEEAHSEEGSVHP